MLSWIGNLFIVAGLYGVGNKLRRAFLASIVGESCWIIQAASKHDWALTSICVVFLLMAVRSYIKWGK